MRPFSGTRRDSFSTLARILAFPGIGPDSTIFGTHTDSILFWCSLRQFFDTRTDSTFSWYSHGFYHFSALTQIRPFFGTRRDSFFDTRTDSTFSRSSPGFYHFSVHTQIRPFFGTRRDSFTILERILHFPGTRPDSVIFRYSHRFDPFSVLVGTFFDTRTDSTFAWYSPGFYHFLELTQFWQIGRASCRERV